MSSDILLEEIRENVKGLEGKFLTKQLDASTVDMNEKINSIILAEHVKITSLKRQHELVNKLRSELPGRIAEVQKQIKSVDKGRKEIEDKLLSLKQEIDKVDENKEKLTAQFDDVIGKLRAKKADEAISSIQREYVWELITKLVELRKSLSPYLGGTKESTSLSAEKERRDIEYLSMRLEQNESLLKSAERSLEELFENRESG